MTQAKRRFMPDPRCWTRPQVAARLGRSASWFEAHQSELEKYGFPKPDPLLGSWDAEAIERWLDVRSGLAEPAPFDDGGLNERLKVLRDGKSEGSTPH